MNIVSPVLHERSRKTEDTMFIFGERATFYFNHLRRPKMNIMSPPNKMGAGSALRKADAHQSVRNRRCDYLVNASSLPMIPSSKGLTIGPAAELPTAAVTSGPSVAMAVLARPCRPDFVKM